jgi:hypothetical protein
MPPRKKLPSWSRHHELWCNIFRGGSCNCDDDDGCFRRPRRPRPSGDSNGPVLERELEDA